MFIKYGVVTERIHKINTQNIFNGYSIRNVILIMYILIYYLSIGLVIKQCDIDDWKNDTQQCNSDDWKSILNQYSRNIQGM